MATSSLLLVLLVVLMQAYVRMHLAAADRGVVQHQPCKYACTSDVFSNHTQHHAHVTKGASCAICPPVIFWVWLMPKFA